MKILSMDRQTKKSSDNGLHCYHLSNCSENAQHHFPFVYIYSECYCMYENIRWTNEMRWVNRSFNTRQSTIRFLRPSILLNRMFKCLWVRCHQVSVPAILHAAIKYILLYAENIFTRLHNFDNIYVHVVCIKSITTPQDVLLYTIYFTWLYN